jgi:predicted phosphodiesterase
VLLQRLEHSAIREYLNYLDENEAERPHVLIVSGDLGTTGRSNELREAIKFIKEEICEKRMQLLGGLHWNRRVIIVPGNHDIQWATRPSRKVQENKFRNFKNETTEFITPFAMPVPDGTRIPFLLIPKIPLLVYGFNSSVGGGEFLPWLEEIQDEFRKTVVAKKLDTEKLRDKILDLARIDAAFIDETDLNIFRGWVKKWRQSAKSHYDEYVKIAVCHHHLSHFPIIEIRKFESVINAGRIKQTLVDCNFDVVLHGHKHLAKGFYEEFLGNLRKGLYIISSGTLTVGQQRVFLRSIKLR